MAFGSGQSRSTRARLDRKSENSGNLQIFKFAYFNSISADLRIQDGVHQIQVERTAKDDREGRSEGLSAAIRQVQSVWGTEPVVNRRS